MNKILRYGIFWGILTIVAFMCIADWIYISTNCMVDEYVLINQEIDKTNSIHGGDCSYGCLFMTFLPTNSTDDYHALNYSVHQDDFLRLYFASETQIRKDLQNYEVTYVRWCNVQGMPQVRGIWQKKSKY